MALDYFGFIFTGRGLDPSTHRSVHRAGWHPHPDHRGLVPRPRIAVSQEMAADGVQLIELCGGFGPIWTGKILEATEGALPIGSIGYPESIDGMERLFPPAV